MEDLFMQIITIKKPWHLTFFELLNHDGAGGLGHVVGGVLLGVGGGDDGHDVVPVSRVNLEHTTLSQKRKNQKKKQKRGEKKSPPSLYTGKSLLNN